MAKPPQEEDFEQVAQKGGSGSGAVSFSQSVSESVVVDDKPSEPDRARGVNTVVGLDLGEWKQIAVQGFSFAFIQLSKGITYNEAWFWTNWTGAKSARLLRGAYHIFSEKDSPDEQADMFIKFLFQREDPGELPPALYITRPKSGREDFLAAVKIWLDRVGNLVGKTPILFCDNSVLQWLLGDTGQLPDEMKNLPLWVASEHTEPDDAIKWTFWQHQSLGQADGVSNEMGFNYFNGSKADLEAFARTPGGKQRLNFALNDRPEGPDRLNYETYADAFAQLLSGRYTQTPLTVGIYASWGMGKSFLLGKIREKLEAIKSADNPLDFAFIPFNAWVYSGSENLWAGLITTLYDGIEKHYESKGARLVQKYRRNQSLKQLWRTFVKSLSLALVFGIPAALYSYFLYQEEIQESWASVLQVLLLLFGGSPILSKLPDLVKGLKSLVDSVVLLRSKELAELSSRKDFKDKVGFMADIQQELRHISDLIRDLDKKQGKTTRFIIFVDDLDRCPPNKAVEALEAIMLLLSDRDRDPFVIFLAMDARVLVKAVEKRYGEVLTEAGISGYEFLDKIVQIPFRIPYAGNDEIKSYVNSLLYQTPEAQKKAEEAERKDEVEPQWEIQGSIPAAGEGTQTPGGGAAAGPATSPEVRGEAAKEVVSAPPEEEAFREEESQAFKSLSPFMSRNPRRVKRIVNIYRLARILLTRSIPPEVAIKWVMLTEQWPFRVAWVLQKIEDELQMVRQIPGDTPLDKLYEDARGNVEDRRSRKLAALDEDAELFESFIRQAPLITAEHISLLWDVTFNLNPAMQNEVLKNAVKNERRFEVRSSR